MRDAGYYQYNNYCWSFKDRPSWWRRFWTKFFLGWYWVDTKVMAESAKFETQEQCDE